MATLSTTASISLPNPQFLRDQSREASAETPYAMTRKIFDRVIGENYRRGKTGYKRVHALFLTWQDDDMHCKETEVSILKKIFEEQCHFDTDYFEIPSEKCQTSLQKKLSEFCLENDDPDCLAILYYAGHGYIGKDTCQYKLAAKWKGDGNGDPSVFFNDIRTCLRQPDCDQLVILDCCFSGSAYSRDRVGKRKFELLTSAAHNAESPAPEYKGSFTKALNKALPQLLKEHDNGFLISDLFSELYHSVPKHLPRPQLFDQSRHDYGKIRIRPQNFTAAVKHEAQAYFLNMTLRINVEPEDVVIYELAKGLSFLPHVNEVRFEKMYEPLGDFFTSVRRTQIAKTLLRLRDRYRARKTTAALPEGFREDSATASIEIPEKQTSQNLPLKSPTWPLNRGTMCSHTKIVSGPILHTETQVKVSGTEALTSSSLSEGKRKSSCLEQEQDIGATYTFETDLDLSEVRRKRQRTASPNQDRT